MKKFIFSLIVFAIVILFIGSCSQIDDSPKALVNLVLVDTPAKWDSVLVEIEGVDVEVLLEGRETGSETFYLEYKTGDKKIRVSDLVAGRALIIGRDELPVGKIIGLKVRMGKRHSLYQEKKGYDMPLQNPEDPFVTLETALDLQAGVAFDIILDLDLESSILQTSTAPLSFELDPVFTVILGAGAGEVKGAISPAALKPAIYLVQGMDSISTQVNTSGSYLFRVPKGTYSLYFDPKDPTYNSQRVTNVQVDSASITQLELVTFTKKQ
ncbi:DUF4382 domain-containing protein [Algoriphagus marinus]|uniref:DUF4382 domain-containing protein n=1 Tax=Algoriphagus marinus TaxID=1925762 RepID=UPI00094B8F04|nr:DUF4382 domain-containing protein [Algoriphagus marinus]